jgi:acetoin utilization deacetylase AcuC-like enzyme
MAHTQWSDHRFWYTDHITVALPEGHRFPMEKYRLLREALLTHGLVTPQQLLPAPGVGRADLLRVHTHAYVHGLESNTLEPKLARLIGLPMGEELFQRSLASVGGFVQSTLQALESGFGAQLAGGTHHAFADRGEGFCVFNDFAVAALKLLGEGLARRILILDLDVHQGNGTSAILGGRQDVFIVSLHGERNYPFRKVASHWDVPLPAGVEDAVYLRALDEVLEQLRPRPFDMLFYQAGVDVLEHDSLGTFKLSFDGVRERDRRVFEFARLKNLPIAMAIGGGYARPIHHTIQAHVGTFEMARRVLG